MRKILASIATVAMLTAGLSACGEQEPEYVGVCVDPQTEERLPDNYCDEGDPNYMPMFVMWWMMSGSNHSYPPVGGHASRSHFKTHKPKFGNFHKGLPKTGGTSVKSWSSGKSWGTSKSSGSSSWGKSGTSKSGSSWGKSSGGGGFSSGRSGGGFSGGRR